MNTLRKLQRKPAVLALLLLAAVFLSECLGAGPLGSLDWDGTRLVRQTDLGATRANFWLAGGVLPVVQFEDPDALQILVRTQMETDVQN